MARRKTAHNKLASKEEKARFEEGKSVDVAEYLRKHKNPGAAEKWEENTDKYEDKFKTAEEDDEDGVEARFEEGKSVDVAEYLRKHKNPGAAKKWEENTDKYEDKFKKSASTPADIAFQQFGGRRALIMLGGRLFKVDDNTFGIKWPNKKRTRGNYVEVRYNPGSDLYTMTFFNVSRYAKKKVKEFRDLQADQLGSTFESQTGWYLRMASTRLASAVKRVLVKHPEYRTMLARLVRAEKNSARNKHGLKTANKSAGEWISIDEVRELCPPCADKMASLHLRRVKASTFHRAMKAASKR